MEWKRAWKNKQTGVPGRGRQGGAGRAGQEAKAGQGARAGQAEQEAIGSERALERALKFLQKL